VTVTGANFSASTVTAVTFGGVAGTKISVIDSNHLTVIPPAGPAGPVDVTVSGTIASGTLRAGYNYGSTLEAPTASSNLTGIASVGTIVAGQFIPGKPTGLVAITPSTAFFEGEFGVLSFTLLFSAANPTNWVDIAVADLNQDGLLDFVLLEQGNNVLIIAINTGTPSVPTFSFTVLPLTTLPAGTEVGSMALGFIGNSPTTGLYDIAITTQPNPPSPTGTCQVLVFQGVAGPTFDVSAPKTTITLPAGTTTAKVACADPSKKSTDVKQLVEGGVRGLDMNGDGKADLVVALSALDQVAVYCQSSTVPYDFTTTAPPPSIVSVGNGCHDPQLLALGDLENNGRLDVVVGNTQSNNVSVFHGNGAGSLSLLATYAVTSAGPQALTGLVLADFNKDCRLDLVTSNVGGENIALFLGHGDGTFAEAVPYNAETSGNQAGANIVSIDHDATFNTIYCLDANQSLNKDQTTSVPRVPTLPAAGNIVAPPYATLAAEQDPEAIAFGDVSNDGHLDIVVANRSSGTIQVFLNDGNGNFTQPFGPVVTGLQPESIAIADVNNDGLNDVLVACNGSNAVFVHLNLGGGSLGAGTAVPVNASGPHQVVAADMDGDGKVDFVTVNQYTNNVSVLIGDGMGDFVLDPDIAGTTGPTPQGTCPVGNAPLGLAVADLNGDGVLDIVTANSSDDTVTVLLRDNSQPTKVKILSSSVFPLGGLVAPAPSQPATATSVLISTVEPVSVAVADLNQDGMQDIVVAGKGTGTVTILHNGKGGTNGNFFVPTDYKNYGSATTIGLPPVVLVTGANPSVVVCTDMNDDGLPDILVGTFGGSNVQDFINQGALTQSAATTLAKLSATSPDVAPSPGEVNFQLLTPAYPGAFVSFTAAAGAPVTGMAAGGLIVPCVPVVGTTGTDNNFRLFQVK
jgi:hypothetical protein